MALKMLTYVTLYVTELTVLKVLLVMIVTTLCMKVLIVKLNVIGRSFEKKTNCTLFG